MNHILNLISNDPYVRMQAERFLLDQWPQLNNRTKIQYARGRIVHVAEAQQSFDYLGSVKKVAISGWKRLRDAAMKPTLKDLDDPDVRIVYSRVLWGALFKLPLYYIWRLKGDSRGFDIVPDLKLPPVFRREIELRHYGWQVNYEHWEHDMGHVWADIICGYDPTTDTFYILK